MYPQPYYLTGSPIRYPAVPPNKCRKRLLRQTSDAHKTWLGADLQQPIDIRHRRWVHPCRRSSSAPVQIFRFWGCRSRRDSRANHKHGSSLARAQRWMSQAGAARLMRKPVAYRIVSSNSPSVSCKLTSNSDREVSINSLSRGVRRKSSRARPSLLFLRAGRPRPAFGKLSFRHRQHMEDFVDRAVKQLTLFCQQ